MYLRREYKLQMNVSGDAVKEAEVVLKEKGIAMDDAVNLFLNQICLEKDVPSYISDRYKEPLSAATLTKEELEKEVLKGLESCLNGDVYTADEVEKELKRMYGI